MDLPATIRTSVSQHAITKVTRLFNNGVGDVLSELLQNARRAGATRVDIDVRDGLGGSVLVIRDDGSGIEDPTAIVTLGDSGWHDDTACREDPAGMGMFSLAGRHVDIRSRSRRADEGWRVVIPSDAWETSLPVAVEAWDCEVGTEIRVIMPPSWNTDLVSVVAKAARHYPFDVTFAGDLLERTDFLAKAESVEEWNGCRIGIYCGPLRPSRIEPSVNFHGVTVCCPIPSIAENDGTSWYARADILEAAVLQLVLPARKEVVQNEALNSLFAAVECMLYRAIERNGSHRLGYQQWLRACELGFDLPEAKPWLWKWAPGTANDQDAIVGERIDGVPMVIFPATDPAIEQCSARVFGDGDILGGTLVAEVRCFEGYRWYDALPRVSAIAFGVEVEDCEYRWARAVGFPKTLQSGQVSAIWMDVALASSRGLFGDAECLCFDVEVLVVPDVFCPDDLEEARILLGPGASLEPCDLADLLEAVCFCPSSDACDDSWYTQHRVFVSRARQMANAFLLGEDAAVIERIRAVIDDAARPYVPAGRKVSIVVSSEQVEVAFVDGGPSEADAGLAVQDRAWSLPRLLLGLKMCKFCAHIFRLWR
jgi:hypothetical protein